MLGIRITDQENAILNETRRTVDATEQANPAAARPPNRESYRHDADADEGRLATSSPQRRSQRVQYQPGEDQLLEVEHNNNPTEETDNQSQPSDGTPVAGQNNDDSPVSPMPLYGFDLTDSEPEDQTNLAGDSAETNKTNSSPVNLCPDFREFCEEPHRRDLSAAEMTGARLMATLRRNKAPLKAYKDLSEWNLRERGLLNHGAPASEASADHYVSREVLIKTLAKRYGMDSWHCPTGGKASTGNTIIEVNLFS